MTAIVSLSPTCWDQPIAADEQTLAVEALERGSVLLLPRLAFAIADDERTLLTPAIGGRGKNISLDPAAPPVRGSSLVGDDLQRLTGMLARFGNANRSLIRNLLPGYADALAPARISYRPAEIAGRRVSWRKDDTRLHVDSFPSSPTQGQRILRVFSNIHPQGQVRHWRLGESFDNVARRFLPAMRQPLWGSDRALQWLGITKRRRTAYDHYMLRLHDRMKADLQYQSQVAHTEHQFQAGTTWLVYTDLVSHAAMRGQHALEQTYLLPVAAMQDPSRSPLRILEGLAGRALA
jgi:hypothetical protein